jgi:NAD(P)-dependent dehydrogenase (short-subunit alcohol dehydrogenase family)
MQSGFDLSGRVAVITGATKGMGMAIANSLGRAGASLVISGRSTESVAQAQSDLAASGIRAKGFVLDVSDAVSVESFTKHASAAFGKVDILVLNAAANTPSGSILSQTVEQLDAVIAGNVRASFVFVNALVPQMIERRDGSVIFMSSRAAKRGTALLGLYAMAKAAIDQYVRNLALELGPSNINVNSICPGPVRTEFSRILWEDAEMEARMVATTPMRRIGAPEDVAGLALLLASPAGRFIHGQNISVDGGMTA